jgi:hypothetical protein
MFVNETAIDTTPVMTSTMDEFNRLTAEILAVLYDTFPILTAISPRKFFENAEDWQPACFEGTIRFLAQEGFITFSFMGSASDGPMYFGTQLTLKGLGVLDRSPDSLERRQKVIDRIKAAIKVGKNELFKEAVKLLMSESVKWVGGIHR